jgi:hypothetical protein
MLAPEKQRHALLALPGCGAVRCLAAQPHTSAADAYLAVATAKAGLLIAKPSTGNLVHMIPAPAGVSVWSAAWSSSNAQQLLLGLDRGRMALVDLRMSLGSSKLISLTSGSQQGLGGGAAAAGSSSRPNQPLHTVAALPQGWWQQHAAASDDRTLVEPEALVACAGEFVCGRHCMGGRCTRGRCCCFMLLARSTACQHKHVHTESMFTQRCCCPWIAGGVYAWCSEQPDHFQLLLSSSDRGGGTCESLCLNPTDSTVVTSFRAPLAAAAGSSSAGAAAVPVHIKAQLSEAAAATGFEAAWTAAAAGGGSSGAGVADAVRQGQQQLLSSTLHMSGHTSSNTMTHGCFVPPLPGLPHERTLFASADEASCEPRLWGCSSGAQLLQRAPWRRLASPVHQLASGTYNGESVLLGALCDRECVLYQCS